MSVVKQFVCVGLIISLLLLMSCASIIKGTSETISINSNPDKASVVVRTLGGVEAFSGATPATIKLSKKQEYTVTVSLAGYKDAVVPIMQEFQPWFLGNLLCGGIIGGVVDAVDGAMWKLEPNNIMVSLTTASLENGDDRVYAVFYAIDNEGQLRSLAVPLVKEHRYTSY